jgi:hypothetical protein
MWYNKDMSKSEIKNQVSMKGVYKFTLTDINTGEVTIQEYENIVPLVARALIAKHIYDPAATPPLLATHAALGTGTSSPAAGNTQLQTEAYRNSIASRTGSSNVSFLTAFYSATETFGTYTEAGIFINATGVANSGILLSRVSINVAKTNTQTLTMDWTLTVN